MIPIMKEIHQAWNTLPDGNRKNSSVGSGLQRLWSIAGENNSLRRVVREFAAVEGIIS